MTIITDQNHPSLRRLHLTLVDQVQTTQVKHISETWFEITRRLTKKPIITTDRKTKADGSSIKWALFVPFKMRKEEDGAYMNENGFGITYSRRESNVVRADIICFDIDNDPKTDRPKLTIAEAKELFAGAAYCLYTSYNHRNTYKHNVDKFRIVLPLKDAVSYEEFRDRKQALKELFPFIDLASLSISQPFYVPVVHPDREHLHYTHVEDTGEWFDLLALEAAKAEASKVAPSEYVQTGDVHPDLPTIRLKGGATYRADDLYNVLQAGYRHRKGCYRIDATDNKAGCFVYRHESGLRYFDPSANPTTRFIKVMKTKRVGTPNPFEHEEDVETTTLWTRKPRAATETSAPVSAASEKPVEILSGWDPSQFEIRRLNCRYLPSDLYMDIPDRGITVIRSPKGTGKTELLAQLTQQEADHDRNVVLLGHRIFLLKNLASRAGLNHYQDGEHGVMTSRIAITLDSLTWIDPEKNTPYHTIIIDESEQVLQHLLAKTLGEISTVFRNLVWLFKNAKRIICLDADLSSDLTIEFIQELRGNREEDNVLGVINDYSIGAGKTTTMYEKRFHLLTDVLSAIDEGKNVFITCNNKRFAKTVDAICRDMGKMTLLVTADTNDTEEARAFIENPTKECKKYQVVVSSPTLSTGVSIGKEDKPETKHFDKVCGFFGINPGTYQDVDQAISRVRNCTDVSVWVQPHTTVPVIPTEEEIYWDAIERERKSVKTVYGEDDVKMTQGQLLWARLYARLNFLIRHWSVHKDRQFLALRTELGFTIEHVEGDDVANSTGTAIYSSFKNVDEDRAEAIFNAEEIYDPDEIAALGRKKQRTHAEQLALERHRLWDVLGHKGMTVETIRKALQQELLQSLAKIRNLHMLDMGEIAYYDKADRKKNKDTFTANRHRVMQRQLINYLCETASIDLHELYASVQVHEEVEITRDMMMSVAKAFEQRKRDFNHYFSLRIKDPTHSKNLTKVWNATFGDAMSLHLERKRKGPKGAQESRHFIDTEKKDLIYAAMKDEAELMEGVFAAMTKKAQERAGFHK